MRRYAIPFNEHSLMGKPRLGLNGGCSPFLWAELKRPTPQDHYHTKAVASGMSEPDHSTHAPQKSAPEASGATESVLEASDDHAVAGPPDKRPHDTATNNAPVTYSDPPAYFTEALNDAERLLKYAAENGIDVDDKTRSSVLEARAAVSTGWNEKTAANLLTALTKLAAQLKPVSAESLLSFNTRPTVRTYWIVAICLAALIVPFSVASFISSAISDSIRKDITTANGLAVKLTTQLEFSGTQTPAPATTSGNATRSNAPLPAGVSQVDVVTELQTFASLIRGIYARSRQLNWLIILTVKDPFSNLLAPGEFKRTFQLPVPLPSELVSVLTGRILVYQDARAFGQNVVDDVSILYGAMATCILPVLYALLGTCAYLLRGFAQQMSSRTFVPSHSDSARFLIAAIGGSVVGLFSNFTINQGASISPLAIAFLVGYAVDVFFSFLEGLIQAFTKSKSGSNTPPPAPAPASTP